MTLPEDLSKFDALREIIARLRAPDGCPWDRKQTHASLRESFLQECYEVLESLDEGNAPKLREELGTSCCILYCKRRLRKKPPNSR